jgi:hypothetical protein
LDNKVAKHNAAVAKLPGGQAHRSNHPDILKTAPKGYSFSVSHKLVPDEQGVAEATGDEKFDTMMKKVAKTPTQAQRNAERIRQKREREEETRKHFANGGGLGTSPADKLSIRKGVAESVDYKSDAEALKKQGNMIGYHKTMVRYYDALANNASHRADVKRYESLANKHHAASKGVAEGSTTRGGFGGSAGQAQHEIEWLKNKVETLKPLLAKKPSVAHQIKDLERQIRERELAIAYQKQGVAEGDNPVDHEWYRKQQERKDKAAKRQDQQQTQPDVVESLLSEFAQGLDGDELAEDAVDDFLARGGEIQQGKFRRPRKSEKTDYGSRHIGTLGGGGKPSKVSGTAANTRVGAKPVVAVEASGCNHTMEGEMCPEHGLAECGMHESQVAESQEGDALLARIKSLALLR